MKIILLLCCLLFGCSTVEIQKEPNNTIEPSQSKKPKSQENPTPGIWVYQ